MYETALHNCKGKRDIDRVKMKAESEGIKITNNGGFKSRA